MIFQLNRTINRRNEKSFIHQKSTKKKQTKNKQKIFYILKIYHNYNKDCYPIAVLIII